MTRIQTQIWTEFYFPRGMKMVLQHACHAMLCEQSKMSMGRDELASSALSDSVIF